MIDADTGNGSYHVRYVLRIAFRNVIASEKRSVCGSLAIAESDFVELIIPTCGHQDRIQLVDDWTKRDAHLYRLARSNIDSGTGGLEAYVPDDQQLCSDPHSIQGKVAVLVGEDRPSPHRHF